jgi:hypothetical protein
VCQAALRPCVILTLLTLALATAAANGAETAPRPSSASIPDGAGGAILIWQDSGVLLARTIHES